MLKSKWALILLLFLFLAPLGAAAQSMVAAEYGPWSDWQSEPFAGQAGLEVERQLRTVTEDSFEWHYRRYVYFNTEKQAWFAAAREQQGSYCREDSGYWEETTEAEPLAVTGQDGEDLIFGQGWFNEEVRNRPSSMQREMYRSRVMRKVTCEVSSAQMLLFPGDSRQLSVNFFDGGALTYLSGDNAVATVDQSGMVTAQAAGAAQLTVRSSKGREVVVEVLVCQEKAHVPDGVYTLRLLGTTKTLAQGKSITRQSDNLVVKEFNGERPQRFVVTGAGSATFTMHPLNHKKWFVDIARRKGKVALGSNVQTHQKKDRGAQYWRAVYVPDGSYILYPKAEPKLVMGAESEGAGNNVRLEALDVLDEADRWLLVKSDTSVDPQDPFVRPVARDGVSYVQSEYSQDHPGIRFGAGGRRAFVLSAARGTVLQVWDACGHDYPKTPGEGGRLIDPCGADEKSLGKYVLIDHGGGVTALYAHLSSVFVSEGDSVRQGSLLGRSGATGSTDQVGLYFELRVNGEAIDPRGYIKLPALGEPIEE